jgi:surface polysaccharide O-acyltransferase-like enzyme
MKSQSVLDPAALPAPQTSPIVNRNSSPPPSREYGLDWLRVFAFSVLILYHTGMIFVSWDFHIKNAETSKALEWAMLLANRWRLPLLFLISGAAVFFSLRTRSYSAFVLERLRRLLIPVAFGMLVIVPPQIYFERLQQGARLTYLEWYPTVFDFQPYPQGSFSWHHLWFVVYILVYSLLGIPFFQWVRSEQGRRAVAAMVRAFERWPWTLYLINLPNLVAGLTLGPHWPTTHNLVADWANFTGCFLTFLWGVTIASNRRFLDIATERRREFLIAGLAIAAAFFTLRATGWLGLTGTPRMLVVELLSAYFGMTWVLFLIGYARHWFRHGGPKLRYANEAVYPFYIVHQTVTIAVGYYVLQQPWGVWPKFAVVAVATFLGSWLCFEIVRRTALTRLLFGLKP